jgi:hypothetical protein
VLIEKALEGQDNDPDSTVFCVRIKNRVAQSKAIPSNPAGA